MKSLTRGHLKAGLDSLRGAKWRNTWTMLGVIIGVASVLSIVGIGEGVKQQVAQQVNHVSKDLIVVQPSSFSTTTGFGGTKLNLVSGPSISGSLSAGDIAAVQGTKGVSVSAPLSAIPAKVTGDYGSYTKGMVLGTNPNFANLVHQSMAYGVFLTTDDDSDNAAVLGQTAATKLFKEDVPLGSTFMLDGQQFIVRGILNSFGANPLSGQNNYDDDIFIPNPIAESISNNSAVTYEIFAKPTSGQPMNTVIANIQSSLKTLHGGQDSISVQPQSQNLANSNEILELLTRLISGAAAISLLVSGIGIMNVMLVSVTERMHEIGIRKAIGATNRQILSQFMIEATVLSVSGGLIGIAIAFILELGLRLATSMQPDISWQITVIALGVSLAVGIVFGSFPAYRAARKDPIEALRSD